MVSGNKKCAVLIPFYKESLTLGESFSLTMTRRILSTWDKYLIGPDKLRSVLIGSGGEDFSVKCFMDQYFNSIKGYNRLLLSPLLYDKFQEYEYVLIVQLDALVISDSLMEWCDKDFSYVGAPWFEGFTKATEKSSFLGVGNGGFSLRNVEHAQKVLKDFKLSSLRSNTIGELPGNVRGLFSSGIFTLNKWHTLPRWNEDMVWGLIVPHKCNFFVVPSIQQAARFSFEVNPRRLFELNGSTLPFGCHAWQRYDSAFWFDVLGESFFGNYYDDLKKHSKIRNLSIALKHLKL